MSDQPVPFEIVTIEGNQVGANGHVRVTLDAELGGVMFKRRGVSGINATPPGEILIPQLNELAGELLANPNMPIAEAVGRLAAISGTLPRVEPQKHEWLVVDIDGVKVYTDGFHMLITRKELTP